MLTDGRAGAGTSVVLSFQLGNCTFDSDWTQTKEIECEQPSLVYIKSPAVLTAPYKSPVSFTDEVGHPQIYATILEKTTLEGPRH